MAFDPSKPAYKSPIVSAEIRYQFNALAADWPERISLAGAGATVTRLGGINGMGAPGANGADEAGGSAPGPGTDGGNGFSVRVGTDGTVNLGTIDLRGGAGGDSGRYLDGTYPEGGGTGGNGGSLELTGCALGDALVSGGISGRMPHALGGASGSVTLLDCTAGALEANGGLSIPNGPGGTVTLTRCIYTSVNIAPGGMFNDTPTAPGSGVSSNVVR